MAEAGYYIRARGKISGPFDLPMLQKLVKRGNLSRMHEVSSDRTSWIVASDYAELFPQRMVSSHTETPSPASTSADHGQAPSAFSGFYHYVQNGVAVGPLPLPVLQSLAQNGTLRAEDMCWPDGAQTATPAAQVPALAAVFSHNSGTTTPRVQPVLDADRSRARGVLGNVYFSSQIGAIVIGFVIVLFLNLPIGSENGKTIWCWNALKSPRGGAAGVLLFFILFSGLTVGVAGATLRGFARAWVNISISALSFVIFLVVGFSQASADGGFFFSLIVLYLAAALAGLSDFRARAPHVRLGAIFQAITGGGLLFAIFIVFVVGVANSSEVSGRDWWNGEQTPSWLIVALTVGGSGILCAIVAGILGLVGLKPKFSHGMNWTTIGCSIGSIALSLVAVVIVGAGVASVLEVQKKGIVIFLVFRMCAVFAGFVGLMGFGLMELFAESHLKPIATNGRRS